MSNKDKKIEVVFKEAKELLELAFSHDQKNREEMITDLEFAAGFQWDQATRDQRGDRPTLTIDKVNQHIKLATGDIRNNPPAIDVLPNDSKSDVKTAKTLTELIRQIEYQSGSNFIYSHAGRMAATCGLGAWRIDTKYLDDTTFSQEIVLRHIPNPLSVYFDQSSINPDKSDASFVFVTEMVSTRDFKVKYPGKSLESVSKQDVSKNAFSWGSDENIRVAEYWYKKPVKKHLIQANDGSVHDVTEQLAGISKTQIAQLVSSDEIAAYRVADSHEIHQLIFSGKEVLKGPAKWPGKFFPIFIVTGDETPVEDKIHRSGVVRRARDPQIMYNLNRSNAAEVIAMAPKQPYIATVKQIGKYQDMWTNANMSSSAVLFTDIDKDFPGGIPQRQRPADPPGAIWQEAQLADQDIKSVTGIYDASLGAQSNEISGKAILARQRQGDLANSDYMNKLKITVAHCGKALVDLIPRIYDTERVVRLLGEDGEHRFETINETVTSEDGQSQVLNDLSIGRFDVRIKTGPSYATRRIEQADKMLELMQSKPDFWSLIGDLVFETMDFPASDKIAKRIKKTIPQQLLEEEGEELPATTNGQPQSQPGNAQQQAQNPDPMLQKANEMKLEEMAAKINKMLAEGQKLQAQTEHQNIENQALQQQLQSTPSVDGIVFNNEYPPQY